MEYVLPKIQFIKEKDLASPDSAGSKAYRLHQLASQGYRVPDFFCIAADCRQQYIGLAGDEKQNYQAQLKKTLSDYVLRCFPEVKSFSVRTSAWAEDSAEASYAGQFKTFLRIAPENLGQAVLQCWEAIDAAHILIYQERRNITEDSLSAGIIIQQMIEADTAGVAFSANPQGILNETVVVCGRGTGDQVVEDRVPTTTYYFNQHSRQFYYEQESDAAVLSPSMLQQIAEILHALATDMPVDIEYAIKDDTLWILQQRPITALSVQYPIVLDNSNIVESYGGLCLPLTIAFAKYVYTQVFLGLARRCLPQRVVLRYETLLSQMVNSANGRMYYQISNWYTILKFLPLRSKIIPVWQRMMGVQVKQYDQTANPVPWGYSLQIHFKIIAAAFGIPRKMKALEKDFLATYALFQKEFRAGLEPERLTHLFQQLGNVVLRNWDITLLNDMYAFLFTGLLERQFRKSDIEDYQERSNRYLSGNKDMESMKPVRTAWELVEDIRQDTALHIRLSALQNDAEVQRYLAGDDTFAPRVNCYLELYGDRSHEELKLETQTFRSNPLAFIQLLLNYAENSAPPPPRIKPLETEESLAQFRFLRRKWIRYLSKRARLGIVNRETSRLNRGRIYGMVRSIFTEMGAALHQAGQIEHPRDVFYLDMEELFAYAQQKDTGSDFALLIEKRKEQYKGFVQLPAYSRLVFANQVFDKHASLVQCGQNISADGRLRGTPCSQGVVEGEVVVVTTPVSTDAARDKILVARTTDPGWVFLLAVAKGVIAEKGSLLSHTAIISRELGLPSVVGVDNATKLLKSGDIVRLDGGRGIIEKCDD